VSADTTTTSAAAASTTFPHAQLNTIEYRGLYRLRIDDHKSEVIYTKMAAEYQRSYLLKTPGVVEVVLMPVKVVYLSV
jgi:hypothetical protein